MFRPLLTALLLTSMIQVTLAQPEDASNQNPEQNFVRDGTWANPTGKWDGNTSWVAADGKGQVYVLVRRDPHVRIYDRDGNFIRQWSGEPATTNPHSITVDNDGNIWITETYSHIVLKFSPDGDLLMTLGERDQPGDNDEIGRFNQPNHVFIHDSGNGVGDIYVSDGYVNSRIMHFSPDGKFIRMIGGKGGPRDGEFQAVHGVAVTDDGRIITNDSENFRVNVCDRDGQFLESWPYRSRGGIEIVNDRIYISDVNEGEVNILTLDGELIDTAYAPRAHGLGVDTDGTIYTSGASRMTVFKLTPKP